MCHTVNYAKRSQICQPVIITATMLVFTNELKLAGILANSIKTESVIERKVKHINRRTFRMDLFWSILFTKNRK